MTVYEEARHNMVLSQLLPQGVVSEGLLKIMGRIPREKFAPSSLEHLAYSDTSLKVFKDRFLLAPATLGRLLQEACIQKEEKILDIGFGTGYSSILLSFLCHQVVSLESHKSLIPDLNHKLEDYEIRNVLPVWGPLEKGWPEEAPYDLIFIGGALEEIPPSFKSQLKEGGRIITLLKKGLSGFPQAIVLKKEPKKWVERFPFEGEASSLEDFKHQGGFIL